MSSVDIDDLADAITEEVKKYTDDVSEAIEEEVKETSKKVRKEAKDNSPEQTGEYKKGWRRKRRSRGGEISYFVHNKNKPQLVHLLEYGHALQYGGSVSAIPHLRPAYDNNIEEMQRNIERIIKNGGG